jgi:hypothetical protein
MWSSCEVKVSNLVVTKTAMCLWAPLVFFLGAATRKSAYKLMFKPFKTIPNVLEYSGRKVSF